MLPAEEVVEGWPLLLVAVVRRRASNTVSGRLPYWPWARVTLRLSEFCEIVTIRAGPSWVVLAGATQASTVTSPALWTAWLTFVAAPPELIVVEASMVSPPPPTQVTLPGLAMVRSSGAPAPESPTVDPEPSVKS